VATVFRSLVPVFLLIVTGTLLHRFAVRDLRVWTAAERLVYYGLFPLLLISTLATADLGSVPATGMAAVLATAILLMSALCLALRRPLAARHRLDGPAFTSLFQGSTRWQTSVALAVAANLYGDRGIALAAVGVVAMIPLLNVINVWVLAHFASPQRPDWRSVALAIARNPLIWGCAIGAVLHATAPLPPAVYDTAGLVGGLSLPLGLLLVGSGLDVVAVLRPRGVTVASAALKLIVMPALAVSFGALIGLRGTTLAVVACCASVPTASNAYVLARQMGGDAPLMAEILTVQTLAAFVTMPVVIAIAAGS
jgi:predicted permease